MKLGKTSLDSSPSSRTGNRREGRIWPQLAAALCLAFCAGPASALPVMAGYLNPNWTDADKLHDFGNWGTNYWNDDNGNGRWDSSEALADRMDPTWTHGAQDTDLSCWIASAANMLAGAGFGSGNAQNIYWDMVYNMSTDWFPGGWQYAGWQHEALNWYLANRPHPLDGIYEVGYYGYYLGQNRDGTSAQPWPTDPFDRAADLLASGYQVGIVVHGSIWHAVTFQGYFYDDETSRIDITDSDDFPSHLDHYAYASSSSDWELTDYVPGGIPVDYFATLRHISSPGTLPLAALGAIALGALGRRRSRG